MTVTSSVSFCRVLCLFIALSGCARAQPTQMQALGAEYYRQFTKAQDLAGRNDLAQAAAVYEQLTRAYPDDVEVWIALGDARAGSKQYRAGAEAFEQAVARGGEYDSFVAARIARLYAQAGEKNLSLAWIEKALALPLENRLQIADDDAFAQWRDDDRFRKLAGLLPKRTLSREEGWNYDLDFFVSEIRRMHYAYHSGPLPTGFEEDVRGLRKRIPELSDAAMRPEIQRLLARLGDGHTSLGGAPHHRIPCIFYEFSDGFFMIDAPDDCRCIGDRVVAVGPTPIRTAVQKITPFLSVDNAMGVRLQAPVYLRDPEYLRAAGIASSDSEVALTLEGRDGSKHTYSAKSTDNPNPRRKLFPSKLASAGAVPRYLKQVDDDYWLETLPDGGTVYFQFNQVLNKPQETIEQFAPRLREALVSPKIRNLIVDVRHNSGGNLTLFSPVLRAIIAFEASRDNPGIYVITGRQTFSAAQVFVNELDHYTSAIFAGEPAGSKPNFIGESAPTKLPYSGLTMTISTRYHQTDDQDRRTWIAPKIPVALSSEDYFANRDPVMDAVLETIRTRPR
jgi:hypothetical protein